MIPLNTGHANSKLDILFTEAHSQSASTWQTWDELFYIDHLNIFELRFFNIVVGFRLSVQGIRESLELERTEEDFQIQSQTFRKILLLLFTCLLRIHSLNVFRAPTLYCSRLIHG